MVGDSVGQIRRNACTGKAADVIGNMIGIAKKVQENVKQTGLYPVK